MIRFLLIVGVSTFLGARSCLFVRVVHFDVIIGVQKFYLSVRIFTFSGKSMGLLTFIHLIIFEYDKAENISTLVLLS